MLEFCECGSLKINDQCSNKSCSHRNDNKPAPKTRVSRAKKVIDPNAEPKKPSTRKSSKVVTYNLYDV